MKVVAFSLLLLWLLVRLNTLDLQFKLYNGLHNPNICVKVFKKNGKEEKKKRNSFILIDTYGTFFNGKVFIEIKKKKWERKIIKMIKH